MFSCGFCPGPFFAEESFFQTFSGGVITDAFQCILQVSKDTLLLFSRLLQFSFECCGFLLFFFLRSQNRFKFFQQGGDIRCVKAFDGVLKVLPALFQYLYFTCELRAIAQAQQGLCITADVVNFVLNFLAGFLFCVECRKGIFAVAVNRFVFALSMFLQFVQYIG